MASADLLGQGAQFSLGVFLGTFGDVGSSIHGFEQGLGWSLCEDLATVGGNLSVFLLKPPAVLLFPILKLFDVLPPTQRLLRLE